MTARLRRTGREFMQQAEAMPQGDDFMQRIRALEALPPGLAIFAIEVFEIDIAVITGERFEWLIPEDLDGSSLVKIEGYVTAPSSSGTVTVQIQNETEAGPVVDLLTTELTIDVGDLNSKDAATPAVIDPDNTVAWGDHLVVEVVNAGTGTLGLGIVAYFLGEELRILVEGAQGAPGGMSDFEGDWTTTTVYLPGQIVVHDGIVYIVTVEHTAGGTNEPGTGVDWEDFWETLIDVPMQADAHCLVNGNGYVLNAGTKGALQIPFDGTIIAATMLADVAGNCVVDIWKETFGGYPPDVSDSIVAATPPTLSGAIKNVDSTLAGWTTAVAEDDILVFVIDSVDTIRRLSIILKIQKGA